MTPSRLLPALPLPAAVLAVSTLAADAVARNGPPERHADRPSHHRPSAGAFDVTLSTRPEYVSGGDVLVRIDVPRNVAAHRVEVFLNGTSVPMIDYRAYSDLLPGGDPLYIHMKFHSFSLKERLQEVNGHADNLVMLLEDFRYGLFSIESPVLIEALAQMDEWLINIADDRSRAPRAIKVVENKPADLVDACWTPEPEPQKIVEEQRYGQGRCDESSTRRSRFHARWPADRSRTTSSPPS